MEAQTVITHALNQGGVVSERRAYAAYAAPLSALARSVRDAAFATWGAAQRLTTVTAPLVRGTRAMGGGLVPLRNAGELYREGRVPSRVRPSGVSLVKRGDREPVDTELCVPYGDGTAPALRVNLARTSCDWCEGSVPARFVALSRTSEGAWVERFCGHHAFVYGSFRPVGFVESV